MIAAILGLQPGWLIAVAARAAEVVVLVNA